MFTDPITIMLNNINDDFEQNINTNKLKLYISQSDDIAYNFQYGYIIYTFNITMNNQLVCTFDNKGHIKFTNIELDNKCFEKIYQVYKYLKNKE